jgi:hypothetical protein
MAVSGRRTNRKGRGLWFAPCRIISRPKFAFGGQTAELRLQVQPSFSAAKAFVNGRSGEYADHPNSWERLSVRMTSLKLFFARREARPKRQKANRRGEEKYNADE